MDPRLSRRIVERRSALSLTQEEAAAQAGISPTTWRNLELGRGRPRELTLARVARALDLPSLDRPGPAADLTLVRRVADILEEQPTAEAILAAFHALCAELAPQSEVSRVTYLVRQGDRVESVATHGDRSIGPPLGSSLTMDQEPLLERILTHGHSLVVGLDDKASEVNAIRRQLHAAGIRSVLGLPLRTRGEIVAMLLLSSRRSAAFESVDLTTLEAAGRVVVHVLSSLLVYTTTASLGGGVEARTDVLRLAARLTSLEPTDRALIEAMVERLRPANG